MDAVTEDTIPLFRGMTVGVDIIGPVQLMVSDYGQYEASLRINLKDKYYPIFELGYGKADASDESTRINYKTECPILSYRCGLEPAQEQARCLPSLRRFRYGFTSFKYDVSAPPVSDPVWGGEASYGAEDVSANFQWLEGVFGVDAEYGVPSVWGGVSATSAN